MAPAVMQCCGIVDVDGKTVSAEQKLYQALHGVFIPHLKNKHPFLPTSLPSQGYWWNSRDDLVEIPRNLEMLSNEYETGHLKMAFPSLYPYGVGGLGDKTREVELTWEKQMAWQLLQSHGRYACHEVYMVVVLNIIERRKICLGAKLLTKNSTLPRVASLLKGLNYEEVKRKLYEQSQSKSEGAAFLQEGMLSRLMQVTSVANGLARGSRQYLYAESS